MFLEYWSVSKTYARRPSLSFSQCSLSLKSTALSSPANLSVISLSTFGPPANHTLKIPAGTVECLSQFPGYQNARISLILSLCEDVITLGSYLAVFFSVTFVSWVSIRVLTYVRAYFKTFVSWVSTRVLTNVRAYSKVSSLGVSTVLAFGGGLAGLAPPLAK